LGAWGVLLLFGLFFFRLRHAGLLLLLRLHLSDTDPAVGRLAAAIRGGGADAA
jgi:hypothetical protein